MYKTEEITVDPSYIIRDYSTSDGSQIKYNHNDNWYKIDNYGGEADLNTVSIDEAIKKAYSKSFSPYFNLNSQYLKEYRTISINKEKLNNLLEKYPDSIQKKVLIHQLESGII